MVRVHPQARSLHKLFFCWAEKPDKRHYDFSTFGFTLQTPIALEDLRWLRNTGRTWDHSLTQANVQSQAQRTGIHVRKVSARNTSVACPMCGQNTTPRQRRRVCNNCKTRLNRDVLASRNIAMRALKISSLKDLNYVKSVETRPSKPAQTPGDTTTNSSLSKGSG